MSEMSELDARLKALEDSAHDEAHDHIGEYAPQDHGHETPDWIERTINKLSERINRLESRLHEEQRERESRDYDLERKVDEAKRAARNTGW